MEPLTAEMKTKSTVSSDLVFEGDGCGGIGANDDALSGKVPPNADSSKGASPFVSSSPRLAKNPLPSPAFEGKREFATVEGT